MKPTVLAAVVALTLTALAGGPVARADGTKVWPVNGPVARAFDPPNTVYGPGHRGIDIAGEAGMAVVAAAAGVVTFTGVIDHVPMVTVTHTGVRTTYQPVSPAVGKGEHVVAGAVIGHLQPGHGTSTCLHFGVLRDRDYLDPLQWLGYGAEIRLLPDNSTVPPLTDSVVAGAAKGWPVAGRVTSGYGWRIHPILHVRRFHDGIDIAAACGVPVSTPWPGVVAATGSGSGSGRYVKVSHGAVVTSYMHLSAINVRKGQQLVAGQVLGKVGTTGMSTGCHLHFATHKNGKSINPRTLLP